MNKASIDEEIEKQMSKLCHGFCSRTCEESEESSPMVD